MFLQWVTHQKINPTPVGNFVSEEPIVSPFTIKVRDFRSAVPRFPSYIHFLDEKNTRETVDDEGWMHTGDVAEIDQCGRVKIIDRVKVRHG
jgi:acyl-CoA synthetase (AMP-forming)/AMP-acid ligase II